MARYRVGNEYLSEDEYEQHISSNWKIILFILGATLVGYFMNKWLTNLNLEKEIRFVLVVLSAIPSGYFTSKLSNLARIIFGFIVLFFVASLFLWFIWKML